MSVTTSPPSLQQLGEAAASAWLVQWAGVLGHMAARAADPAQTTGSLQHAPRHDTPARHTSHRVNRTQYVQGNAVSGQRVAQEGKGMTKSSRRTSVSVVKYETAAADTTAAHGTAQPQPLVSQCVVSGCASQGSVRQVCTPMTCVPKALDNATLKHNVGRCSSYLRSQLPPLLLEGITDAACRMMSEYVTRGGRDSSVPGYLVGDWARRAPGLLALATSLLGRKYPLDLSGLAQDALEDVIEFVDCYLPVQRLNKLVLSKEKIKSVHDSKLVTCDKIRRVLEKSSLVSLTLNFDIIDGTIFKDIAKLSLKELDVSGSGPSEREVLQQLCGLPYVTSGEALLAVTSGHFWTNKVSPLRESLSRFSVSFPNIPSAVYQVFLVVFHNLQYYNHPGNAVQCVCRHSRLALRGTAGTATHAALRLCRINLGRANKYEILEVTRACPALKEVSLNIELDSEETLSSLYSSEGLCGVELSYYPSSVSSPPKMEGRVLLPVLRHFRAQLQSLSLTGFSLRGDVLEEMSRLSELRSLTVADSWLCLPKETPTQPFPSLESLTINFLPSLDILRLFTASSCLQSINFDCVASEGHGNSLTDAHVRQLVRCGALTSITSFSSSSPFITLDSLQALSQLPLVRRVGYLARWGLIEDELRCVGHSGPPHVLCRH